MRNGYAARGAAPSGLPRGLWWRCVGASLNVCEALIALFGCSIQEANITTTLVVDIEDRIGILS